MSPHHYDRTGERIDEEPEPDTREDTNPVPMPAHLRALIDAHRGSRKERDPE